MKKSFLFPAIIGIMLFISAAPVQAQFNEARYGIKAGFTAYSVTLDNGESSSSDLRLGWTIAVFANIPINPMFSFQPELAFTQKGGQDSFFGTSADTDMILNFIEIPLLIRYNVPLETEVLPYITLGPTLGYLAGADLKIEGDSGTVTNDFKENLSDFHAGLSLGLGLQLRQFSLDYRYEFGLTDLWDNDSDIGSDTSLKTNGFTVTLGYTF